MSGSLFVILEPIDLLAKDSEGISLDRQVMELF